MEKTSDDLVVEAREWSMNKIKSDIPMENVKAIYDRASLIALDEGLRQKYAKHLSDIIEFDARILLLTLNYPQHQRSGPPFAVSKEEVDQIFNGSFDIQESVSYTHLTLPTKA